MKIQGMIQTTAMMNRTKSDKSKTWFQLRRSNMRRRKTICRTNLWFGLRGFVSTGTKEKIVKIRKVYILHICRCLLNSIATPYP